MENYDTRIDRTFAALDFSASTRAPELTFTHLRLHGENARRSQQARWIGALDKLKPRFLKLKGDLHDLA
jgi:hypothetical protein